MKPPPPPTYEDLGAALLRQCEAMKVHPVVAFATIAVVTLGIAKLTAGSHVHHGSHHGTVRPPRAKAHA